MGLLLNIETATEVCSVSLAREGEVIGLRESVEGQNHSVLLGVYVDELLREHGVRVEDLDAVAVSMGPGSYTGLRIGVSLAKGLCFGGDVPLVAVGTLQALAAAVADRVAEEDALYCPMIDARRMEVYTALFNRAGNAVQPVGASVIDAGAFGSWLERGKVYFFGNGSEKVRDVIRHPNACFVEGVRASATHLARLAEERWRRQAFEDLAYFEPYYLKDFVATTPKRKIL